MVPSSRPAISSGVLSRPNRAFLCGKRPHLQIAHSVNNTFTRHKGLTSCLTLTFKESAPSITSRHSERIVYDIPAIILPKELPDVNMFCTTCESRHGKRGIRLGCRTIPPPAFTGTCNQTELSRGIMGDLKALNCQRETERDTILQGSLDGHCI